MVSHHATRGHLLRRLPSVPLLVESWDFDLMQAVPGVLLLAISAKNGELKRGREQEQSIFDDIP